MKNVRYVEAKYDSTFIWDNEDTSSLVARPKGDIRLPIRQHCAMFKQHSMVFGGRDT